MDICPGMYVSQWSRQEAELQPGGQISENGLNEHLCNSFLVLLTRQRTLDYNLNTFIYLYTFNALLYSHLSTSQP